MKDKKKQYARQQQWEREHYERVSLNLPKGKKALWMAKAQEQGMSLTEYIIKQVEAGS